MGRRTQCEKRCVEGTPFPRANRNAPALPFDRNRGKRCGMKLLRRARDLLLSSIASPSMLLLIDNYDSFTWNLVQAFGVLDRSMPIHVVRNDAITCDEARALNPKWLVISPGPCTPKESGVCPDLIHIFRGEIPILGVCLGHQTIGDAHGMTV
ncbi:MAG: para-aminobenzoate synthase glutamine amidotransferase component, partial [Planctomycetota bacterium]